VDELIEDLTAAAHEEIERAAGEGARAAALAALERQAELAVEAAKWRHEAEAAYHRVFRNSLVFGVIGFCAGAFAGGMSFYFLGGR
jgi:hypothetical protein